MRAGRLIDLVHGPARGDEGGEASGPQPLDRARDEIVVQGKAEFAGRIVGADGAVGERRVADREVEDVRKTRLGEILVPDAGVRIEELGDPGGRSVHLDAGQRQLGRQGLRREGEEEARSATWLQNAAAVEAHLAERSPDGADDELRREIRVLRRSLEIREILARDELFELEAEIFPCGGEAFAGAAKELVGEVRGAEGREFCQKLLLVRSGVTAFGLDRGHEPDGGEIVFSARLPALGETAIAGEAVVVGGDGRLRGVGRVDDFGLFRLEVHRRKGRERRSGESSVKAHASAEARGVEEGQGELVVLHGMRLQKGRVRTRSPSSALGAGRARHPHGRELRG